VAAAFRDGAKSDMLVHKLSDMANRGHGHDLSGDASRGLVSLSELTLSVWHNDEALPAV
jgi:hypothetical protein